MADVHLLIPGYIKGDLSDSSESFFGKQLNECISKSNEAEYNSDFLKDCARYALGKVEIIVENEACQNAVLTVMKHKPTNLCIVDIFVPAILANTHWMLCHYCCDDLKIRFNGMEDSIANICKTFGVEKFGSQRSLVFSYSKVEEESLLCLLVNEQHPMGKIVGTHFKNIISKNLAQYDTAKVYASEVTMIEMTENVENDLLLRIQSQGVELFFVEMLLMQDASVSRMNHLVKREIDLERACPFRKNSDNIIYELLDETSYMFCFMDYKQFYFPTVRVSATKVAKAFGIDDIYRRYEQNKALLENMINSHNAMISKKENQIKNSLLFILTFLSGISTISSTIDLIAERSLGAFSYYIASALMFAGISIYWIVSKFIRWGTNRARKKK